MLCVFISIFLMSTPQHTFLLRNSENYLIGINKYSSITCPLYLADDNNYLYLQIKYRWAYTI